MATWTRAGKGIRYQEHPTRKHGKKPDRYWCLQYKLRGKVINEAVGWWSAGASQAQCEELLLKLRENWRAGEGPQTLREMRAFNLKKREAEQTAKKLAEAKSRTLGGYWESEYLPRAELNLTPGSLKGFANVMKLWLAPLSDRPLAEIKAADLENLVQRPMLEAGKSRLYVERALRVFSVVWNQAKAQGYTQGENPVRKIKIQKSDTRRERFLTRAEAVRLLADLKKRDRETHDFVLLSLFSGLRHGECGKLTWGDIDLEGGRIFVKDTKSGRNRHAFITAEIRAMLESRNRGHAKSEKVFPAARGGQGYAQIRVVFNRAVSALGLNNGVSDRRQRVVFHSLRHTFASWLVQMGPPLYTVSQLMGHSDLKMTTRYAHLAPDTQRAAAMELEGVLNLEGQSEIVA